MSETILQTMPREKAEVNSLFEAMKRRLTADGQSGCPVETCYGMVSLCLSASCGKCTPCRDGLKRVQALLDALFNGEATPDALDEIRRLAQVMADTADCAIGFESGRIILGALAAFEDDFKAHLAGKACLVGFQNPIPCVAYCPTHVNVPAYVRLVKEGRYDDAVRVVREDNPFPGACALICEHPCEHHCRRIIVDDAINIRALKRMAVENSTSVIWDAAKENPKAEPTGKKVAVIGAGPSGLTAAYYLNQMGHKVTVFESHKQAGGMLRYGIPAYRLPRNVLDKDIRFIVESGVELKLGCAIGRDESYENIARDFDAVYVGIGAQIDNKLGLDDEDARGVMSAVEILGGIGDGQYPDFSGKDVVIVGGGNVAMDCTRTAKRLGAKSVTCAYRRRKEDMTALPDEVMGAAEEGCAIAPLLAPQRLEVENGAVKGIWFKPQMISLVKDGRPSVTPSDKESVFYKADIIIKAIGEKVDSAYLSEKAGFATNRGRILADNRGFVQTANDKAPFVYAGGDCVTGPTTAIKAIAAGKVAAYAIDKQLGFCHEPKSNVCVPKPDAGVMPPCGRINLSERPAADRKDDFDQMELSMSLSEAKQESSRCLGCDVFGYGKLTADPNKNPQKEDC